MAVIGPNEQYFPSEDFRQFLFRIQRGQVPGYTYEQRHAFCIEASTTVWGTLWSANPPSSYQFLSTAQTLSVSSSSANDTAAGAGMRTLEIKGLDANYEFMTEIVTLNGQAPVTTIGSFFRILNVNGQTFGSTGNNVGDIYVGSGTVTSGVNSNPQGYIFRNASYSEMGVYTVPRGYTLIVFDAKYNVKAGKQAATRFVARPSPSSPFTQRTVNNLYGGPKSLDFEVTTSTVPEMYDLLIQVVAASGNTTVAGDFQIALVDNSYI